MVILFILAAAIVALLVWSETIGSDVMPFSCPSCFFGGDRDLANEPQPWYTRASSERVRCRSCGRHFREHADGSLVEER